MNPETWILQRIREIFSKMLRHESEDVDLVEDPGKHMAAEIWIRRHGSCRGS